MVSTQMMGDKYMIKIVDSSGQVKKTWISISGKREIKYESKRFINSRTML
jgi:hypothetical protein